jgi:LmbE family N-acetylglucosaminyl deacetylase
VDKGRSFVEDALEPFNPALAVVVRVALRHIGVDRTSESARRPALVMAPHPDDETLGAGATIMRKVDAGTPVHVLVVTDGSKSPPGDPCEVAALRSSELATARAVLGLAAGDVTELGFPDAELDPADDTLVDAISDVVAAMAPEEVLVTGVDDPHADHAALGLAARRALAGTRIRLLTYPVWQFERPVVLLRQVLHSGRPELVSTEGYLERKHTAVAAYASQLAARDDDPEGLHPSFLRNFVRPFELFLPERSLGG